MTTPMPLTPPRQPIPVPVNPTVAKSIARPDAFSKPGTSGKWSPGKGVRFRSLQVKKGPGRPRKKLRDPRDVRFY